MKEAGGGKLADGSIFNGMCTCDISRRSSGGFLSKLMLLKDNFQWYQQLVPTQHFFSSLVLEQGYDANAMMFGNKSTYFLQVFPPAMINILKIASYWSNRNIEVA